MNDYFYVSFLSHPVLSANLPKLLNPYMDCRPEYMLLSSGILSIPDFWEGIGIGALKSAVYLLIQE